MSATPCHGLGSVLDGSHADALRKSHQYARRVGSRCVESVGSLRLCPVIFHRQLETSRRRYSGKSHSLDSRNQTARSTSVHDHTNCLDFAARGGKPTFLAMNHNHAKYQARLEFVQALLRDQCTFVVSAPHEIVASVLASSLADVKVIRTSQRSFPSSTTPSALSSTTTLSTASHLTRRCPPAMQPLALPLATSRDAYPSQMAPKSSLCASQIRIPKA